MINYLLTTYIFISTANVLLIKYMTVSGIASGSILLMRGFFCILLVFAFMPERKPQNLVPKRAGLQFYRFLLAGLALLAITSSYQYISATSIALVSRLDLPLVVIFGSLQGRKVASRSVKLALASLVALSLFIFVAHESKDTLAGFILAGAGTVLLAVGYLLLRKTSESENAEVVTLTPAVACVIFGAIAIRFHSSSTFLDLKTVLLGAASGVLMYSMYRINAVRYRLLSVGLAEFPALLVAICVIPGEILIFKQEFSLAYLIALPVTLVLMGLAVFLKERPNEQAQN